MPNGMEIRGSVSKARASSDSIPKSDGNDLHDLLSSMFSVLSF